MSTALQRATRTLQRASAAAAPPAAAFVYHPLAYAWPAHRTYLHRYGGGRKHALFIGMNPGPWGMGQTGIPFGDVVSVRTYLDITAPITAPPDTHPKRPVQGFACTRREVSGARLWALFAQRYGCSENFFANYYVSNYCPLLFLSARGSNLTPDKFPAAETAALYAHCDAFLRSLVRHMQPQLLVGVGDFAAKRLHKVFDEAADGLRIGKILHPSPASPAANAGFARTASAQLRALGL